MDSVLREAKIGQMDKETEETYFLLSKLIKKMKYNNAWQRDIDLLNIQEDIQDSLDELTNNLTDEEKVELKLRYG